MNLIKPDISLKKLPNPLLVGLPKHLKDPENYIKVQKALLETLAGRHSHGELIEWGNCITCQSKLEEHGLLMKRLGFKSPAQYMEWQKVMRIVLKMNTRRDKLKKYNDK